MWFRATPLALFAVWMLLAPGLGAAERRSPNVVLVLTDDQGYGDLGCHGNRMIRTPNLDRLHGRSVRLTNFHVDPTCSPTRSALMTGHYSARAGVWHTIMGRSLLFRDETTMAEVFRASGYRTALFGKWHLGDNYPLRPQDRGFDEVLTLGGGGIGQTPDHWGNSYFDDTLLHNGKPEKCKGYCTDVFFEHALGFIEKNKERPFFVYLATNAPHAPYNVAQKYSKPYRDKKVPDPMANFYGMITNIDENMGRLLERLKESGLEENTILIFMTDNGSAAGLAPRPKEGEWPGFNAGMRGLKASEYDGGHRVPCFVRWPAGRIEGGRDVKPLAAHFDLLPTLIELCGLKKPKGVTFDGTSLVPLLKGEEKNWSERTLIVHSQRIETPEKWRKSAVMTDRWRLVNGKELYDMRDDPGQKNDVAADHAEVVARLRKAYDAWWADVSRRFDGYGYIVLGSEKENPSRLTCHDWHGEEAPSGQARVKAQPFINGYWVVEIERDGRYEVTLRRQPEGAEIPLEATRARVKVGDVVEEAKVEPDAKHVTLTLTLKAGKARLQTWLIDEGMDRSRGAFFVTVRRLP